VENAVPAIISEEMFEKVQKIVEKRRSVHPKAATSEFVFSGVAKCARCGAPLAGKYGFSRRREKIHRPRSYYCTKQRLGLCDQPNMSERFIEQQFLRFLKDIEFNEQLLANVDNGNEDEKHLKERREWIQNELKAIEKRRVKWQYAWANDTISDEDFSQRMKEENEKEEALKEELEQIQPKKEKTSETDVKEVIRNIIVNWSFLEPVEKKMLLQIVVKKLVVDKISSQPKLDSVKIVDIEFY
jgi:site-specific DNA recombinase